MHTISSSEEIRVVTSLIFHVLISTILFSTHKIFVLFINSNLLLVSKYVESVDHKTLSITPNCPIILIIFLIILLSIQILSMIIVLLYMNLKISSVFSKMLLIDKSDLKNTGRYIMEMILFAFKVLGLKTLIFLLIIRIALEHLATLIFMVILILFSLLLLISILLFLSYYLWLPLFNNQSIKNLIINILLIIKRIVIINI